MATLSITLTVGAQSITRTLSAPDGGVTRFLNDLIAEEYPGASTQEAAERLLDRMLADVRHTSKSLRARRTTPPDLTEV